MAPARTEPSKPDDRIAAWVGTLGPSSRLHTGPYVHGRPGQHRSIGGDGAESHVLPLARLARTAIWTFWSTWRQAPATNCCACPGWRRTGSDPGRQSRSRGGAPAGACPGTVREADGEHQAPLQVLALRHVARHLRRTAPSGHRPCARWCDRAARGPVPLGDPAVLDPSAKVMVDQHAQGVLAVVVVVQRSYHRPAATPPYRVRFTETLGGRRWEEPWSSATSC